MVKRKKNQSKKAKPRKIAIRLLSPNKTLSLPKLGTKSAKEEAYRLTLPKIKIVGIGGAGNNALSRIYKLMKGMETIALNTDSQNLKFTLSDKKIQIGKTTTHGRGAGMNPDLGKRSAEESKEEIAGFLQGAELVFITCGLGGGTGSGAAPVVAEICRSLNILTIAVVTMPFSFEGKERLQIAQTAWNNLAANVDALITVNNDRVFNVIDANTSLKKAFWQIDEILREGIQAISDLIIKPGLINVDFADLKAIVQNAGPALLGIGLAEGKDRAVKAGEKAIANPLVDITVDDAHRILINISAAGDLTMLEVQQAAKAITDKVANEAKIIFGANFDHSLPKGKLKVTVVACGFEGKTFSPNSSLNFSTSYARKEAQEEESGQAEAMTSHLKDVLTEKLKPFESLEDQPAFLRKKRFRE